MSRPLLRVLMLLMTLALPVQAQQRGTAGDFDYYVMALSWSPTWCALEGDASASPQCDGTHGWVLHGLWPQYERGWPQDCHSAYTPPSRAQTAAMADIMGTSGLAWYQWNKHGACAGLPPRDYFALARSAYDSIAKPTAFERLQRPIELPASLVEDAFMQENQGLLADQITITCRAGRIQEVRICLTRDLDPRQCGADVIRDCTLDNALMSPVR
ncbi:ribonuclease T2 family protein [Ketogulonicigenium vulgare]|uniref:Ribonuclease T2 family protein n=1 Tax=Ketogulonicigenium vulgare (strain WSH-001) TaxID=759362 RepID=F9Y8C2_KETVW|nr:ribonuclease T2 [Ketogulonicigenium vulgare]ADO41409.1 Ribonuclease T2 family [Ketogulonicigenium vulgare Y25]AEM42408.1 Ribonuclease T2 family protein [Ketogulonicigenium vulgare WSH-001]ALJ80028.1 ribonuclease T [Ketogulonicigenium vulgare]ANW32911.1 ribonuclease T [Ketogulonicigenium vulgare]AOZ53493.1 ribonuclease T2 family [Ketogulonicigenium vulgare]